MEQNPLDAFQERASRALDESITALAEVVAESAVEDESHSHKLLPKKGQKEKLAASLTQEMLSFKHRIENGINCLLTALQELAALHPETHLDSIGADFIKLAEYLAKFEEHIDEFTKSIAEEKSIQELAGISLNTLKQLYLAAKKLYEDKRYIDAADAFGILTMLNPHPLNFWLGLGTAEYHSKRYEAALTAYAFAVYADPESPLPHLYSCTCYEELKQIDNALNALDLALYVLQDKQDQDSLKKQIEKEKMRLSVKK